MRKFVVIALLGFFVLSISGCASVSKSTEADVLKDKVSTLQDSLRECRRDRDGQAEALRQCQQDKDSQVDALLKCREEKNVEISSLQQAMNNLEESLKEEIAQKNAKLEMTERGLIVTFLSEVFFDSGKAKIKEDAKAALGEVATVLKNDVPDNLIAVEGHTDNVPIKYSGWKSNWELASARSLSVLHYFIDDCDIDPNRISAVSFGEYDPVADNETKEGRQKNRRVEIAILTSLAQE